MRLSGGGSAALPSADQAAWRPQWTLPDEQLTRTVSASTDGWFAVHTTAAEWGPVYGEYGQVRECVFTAHRPAPVPGAHSGRICRVFVASPRRGPLRPHAAAHMTNAPAILFSQVTGAFYVVWRVRDSNPRRLSRLIYSQIPLAARATRRRPGAPDRDTEYRTPMARRRRGFTMTRVVTFSTSRRRGCVTWPIRLSTW